MNRSFQKVYRSSINRSPTKSTHAFPKAPRFSYSPQLTGRTSSIPSPGEYNTLSFTQEAQLKNKGPVMCLSKRYSRAGHEVATSPSPSSYSPRQREGGQSVKISPCPVSRSPRIEDRWVGPANYYTEKYGTVGAKRNSICSSFKNIANCKFGHSPRFGSKKVSGSEVHPGPGQYETFSEFAERRAYLTSKLQRMGQLTARR